MENIKDVIAQKHGYADFFQIDMTELEPSEKTEIKSQLLDECVTELQKELNRKFTEWEIQRQTIARYHNDLKCGECNGTGKWKENEGDKEVECPYCKPKNKTMIKSVSDCLFDAGFQARHLPLGQHKPLEEGIKNYAAQFPVKITVAFLRDLEAQVSREEISYSRMVELLNEHCALGRHYA
jgi:hypothetical protein